MYSVKFLDHHFQTVSSALGKGASELEECCFLLCNVSRGATKVSLLVNDVVTLDECDYECHRADRLSVKSRTMLSVARTAQSKGYSVIMVHSHPMSHGEVSFSHADDVGNVDTFKFFNRMLPEGINGCLVFDRLMSAVCGRIYADAKNWVSVDKVAVFGQEIYEPLKLCSETQGKGSKKDKKFCRQELLLGEIGQAQISDTTFGIVGAGGLGSIASAALAHTANCTLLIFDRKRARQHNSPRLIGGTTCRVKEGALKVDIASDYAASINHACAVASIPLDIEDQCAAPFIKDVDFLVCTTDTAYSRAYLNEFCQRHYIPLLEIGVEFTCDKENGQIKSEVGRINLMQPGTACLECGSLVDREKLAYETANIQEREKWLSEGYLKGGTGAEPSMIIFNMEVAARGIQKLLGYITGIIPDKPSEYEVFSFTGSNSETHHRTFAKRKKSACPFCDHKASLVLGLGDQILSSRETKETDIRSIER